MATNRIFEDGYQLSVACSHPATPSSGDPVRLAAMTGVALVDEGEGGNAAGYTSVDFGPTVWDLSVKAIDDAGDSAVAIGDALFYVDADTPVLSKKSSGYFFGFAMEAITSGSTDTINVAHFPPTPVSDVIGAGFVLPIAIADGAGDTDVVLTHASRVVDAWAVKTAADGGAGDTVQVKNAANAITDAMSLNAVDTTIVRAGTIDDAQHEIAAGGTLRVTAANATNNACIVYVHMLRI